MRRHTFHALPALRHAVRRLGTANALPVETRARLVLSVSTLADSVLRAGYGVTLESARTRTKDRSSAGGSLAVTLRTPAPVLAPPAGAELPLPAQVSSDAATWHVPLPAGTPEIRIPAGRHSDDATTGVDRKSVV